MMDEIENLLSEIRSQRIQVTSAAACGGGCINQTQVLSLSNGEKVFLKFNPHPPQQFFTKEAKGLELLRTVQNGPKAPAVVALQRSANPRFLILEYIEERSPRNDFYATFGGALAALHRTSQSHYGLDHDNFIGETVQINAQEQNPIVFFRERRIRFQQELARNSGLLPRKLDEKLDRLCEKLEDFLDVTGEKPALLHGDLWSGNYFAGPNQTPYVFDPAVYFGLREADLAMTELFGKLPRRFYQAYAEAFPLNPGYEERKKLYNLYHLLNHVNLFGGSYLSSVESAVSHFV